MLTRRDFGGLAIAGGVVLLAEKSGFAATPPEWVKLTTEPFKGKQDDMSFVSPDIGWYGNGLGKLYRTTDGGQSWAKIWDKPGTFIRALGFIDEQRGFLGNVGTNYYPGVTDTQPLYRTSDGGKTWDAVTAPGIEKVTGICGIDILPVRRIFQGEMKTSHIIHAAGRVGGPAMVMRSEDDGLSWRVIDLSAQAGMILDVKFLDAKTGFVCASAVAEQGDGEALILRTIDGGKTWAPAYRSGRKLENCWKMSWPTKRTGYATVQSYNDDPAKTQRVIVKTSDDRLKSPRDAVLGVVDLFARHREFRRNFADIGAAERVHLEGVQTPLLANGSQGIWLPWVGGTYCANCGSRVNHQSSARQSLDRRASSKLEGSAPA